VARLNRGRRTRNLYRTDYDDALLDARLGDVRAKLGLDGAVPPATAIDRLAFLGWSAASLLLSLATVAVPLVVVALALRALLH